MSANNGSSNVSSSSNGAAWMATPAGAVEGDDDVDLSYPNYSHLWPGLDDSFMSSSMDLDSSFQESADDFQNNLANGQYYLPPNVAAGQTAAGGEDGDYDDDEYDDADGDEDGEFVYGGDYAEGGEDQDYSDDDAAKSQKSSSTGVKSSHSTPPNRSRTSSPKRASPTRDGRSIPSVSLLYAPKRDARAILGRQYFENPIATFREAHSEVFIVTKKEKSRGEEYKTFAVKRQHLADPDNLADKAYRELRILMQLRRLQERHMCENFVYLRDWIKSVPPLMFPVSGKYGPEDQFLYFELEYAPTPLRSFKNLSLREHKCILFQALYALYIAQKEYKFVHNDLHAKNVLLQEPNPYKPFTAYQDFDRVWYVSGHVVKITDFGLSRLQLETREVVHNPKNSFGEMFSSSRDLEKLAQEFPKVADWSSVQNVEEQRAWLRTLLGKMKNGNPSPKDLLREPFFDDLMVRPEGVTSASTMAFASHGNINNLRRILDGENIVLPPSSDPSWLSEDKDLLAEQYAAMAQLQERFRTLRKQQPNLYIQYIAKSYVKLPRQKKKIRKVPTGPRPPRPPKPKPLIPVVEAPKPAPPPEPVEPEEPLTRDERRQRNDAVRWFREMKEVASGLAALGAVLGPRKARMKQPQPDVVRQRPSTPQPLPRVAGAAFAPPPPSPSPHLPHSEPSIPVSAPAPISPTKYTPKIKLIVTAPSSVDGHVDEEADVDILDEPQQSSDVSEKPKLTPPQPLKVEPIPEPYEEIEITDEMDVPESTSSAVVDHAPSLVHSSFVPTNPDVIVPSAVPVETPPVVSAPVQVKPDLIQVAPSHPTPLSSTPKKRGRPPKTAADPNAPPRPSAPRAPRPPRAPATYYSTEVPKKRSLFSVMNEIANNCSSLEHMFESGQNLGRRRAAANASAALGKRKIKNEAVSTEPAADDASAGGAASPTQPVESEDKSTSVVVLIEKPGETYDQRQPLPADDGIHVGEPNDTQVHDPAELVGLLEDALEDANSQLLDIEDRGRSRDIKKRKSRPDDWDDRPQLRDEESTQDTQSPAAAFDSAAGMLVSNSGNQNDEARSAKRVHVAAPEDHPN